MNDDFRLVTEAARFAAARHAGQTRKGARAEPYFVHLAEVAALLAAHAPDDDPPLLAAAYLHDCVEDGHATEAEIAERFGRDAAALVAELTDDPTLDEAARRRRQVEEIAGKSRRARLLKLADKVSNGREIAEQPPADWSAERRAAYVDWAVAVVDAGCRGLNGPLERLFDAAVAKARAGS